jgi:hypothetical protein
MQLSNYLFFTDTCEQALRFPERPSSLPTLDLRAQRLVGDRRSALRDRVPKGRRPGVSSYRVFMTIVFICVVLVDEWSDRSLSAIVSVNVVGPVSVGVWTLTLLGSFGIGPVAAIWNALRR